MINYKDFIVSSDTAYNIRKALEYCKKNGEDGIRFEKGIYNIKPDYAINKFFAISNHGQGLHRICFWLDEFDGFTIDGGGSEFIFEDVMTPFAINNSKNVTIKNLSTLSKNTLSFQAEVLESDGYNYDLKITNGTPCYEYGGDLYCGDPLGKNTRVCGYVEIDKETDCIVGKTGGYALNGQNKITKITVSEDGIIHVKDAREKVQKGNTLLFMTFNRDECSIFVNGSENTKISEVKLQSGVGMGILAQNSKNIEADRLSVCMPEGRRFSLNADGTHFVHCDGKIHIHDSLFEGQLDDALNVHSLYLRIKETKKDSLIAELVHKEGKGVEILEKGSKIQISDKESLLPYAEYDVERAEVLNRDFVEIFFKEGTFDKGKVMLGDVVDEVSKKAEVLFENCTVRKNRARGMLLASSGKTIIRNNLFETPGPAIKFESNGKFWFESGAVKDVEISGNTFNNCVYGPPGEGVIIVEPKKIEENRYFHGKIVVKDNEFKNCKTKLAVMNNLEQFVFQNNKTINCDNPEVVVEHCKNKKIDLNV